MILGTGVDIVDSRRFRPWLEEPALARRFFSEEELLCAPGRGAEDFLASRFAAKEAFGKALGTGLAGIALRDIAVRRTGAGKPELVLSGGALAAFRASGGVRAHLSLSHDACLAVAFVVIEGD